MSRTAVLFFCIVLLKPVVAGTEMVSLFEGDQFRMELPAVPTGKEMNLRLGQDTFQSVKIATIINKTLTYKDVQLEGRMRLEENTIIISNLTNNDSNVYKIQVNGDRASEKKYNLTVYHLDKTTENPGIGTGIGIGTRIGIVFAVFTVFAGVVIWSYKTQ